VNTGPWAKKHADPHLLVLVGPGERRRELLEQREVHRVALLGAVEADGANEAFGLFGDECGHAGLLGGCFSQL
jgi:hypothetical protein